MDTIGDESFLPDYDEADDEKADDESN